MPTYTRIQGTEVTTPADGGERIIALRRILDRGQYTKIDHCMVDVFSASTILNAYSRLSEENQARFAQLPASEMARIAFKLMK